MSKIRGEMSCSTEIMENPKGLVKILAQGLRMLWNIEISTCPANNSIDNKLKLAEIRVSNNLCNIEDAEPETYGTNGFSNPEELLQWLKNNKPMEELVFSHGDYCLPNIFISNNNINGFIDLGRSGIADKYQDIALCYRSLIRNFDGTYGEKVYDGFDAAILFDELKIVPDWEKIKYYILLDELF
ncbi:aminoglycoside 3'-phosphotransferase [Anaerocolumna sp.]|uniref:aminoglycoside 3'-phosphotransferase n=1 Tax=Anaerocolumna sp. TaxID=2041569 RepID=UPI0028A889AD|nr:aminoglycoside 3'-phosphotransferase [Anaerocolumna sp.]